MSFYHLSGAYCMNFTDASVFSLTGFPIRSSLVMCSMGFYFVSHLNLAAFLLNGEIHIPSFMESPVISSFFTLFL